MPYALPYSVRASIVSRSWPGDDPPDPRRRSVQRRRLAVDRREVAGLGALRVVGVAQLLDLPFAEPADRAGEQGGDLRTQPGGDLRGASEEEVAGEDRLQVAPSGVDRLHAAPRVGLVHDVVVIERSEMHELASDTATHGIVGGPDPVDLGRGDSHHRAQSFAAGNEQMGRKLGEIGVTRDDRGLHRCLDPLAVLIHRRDAQERRRHWGVGHVTRVRAKRRLRRPNVPHGTRRGLRVCPSARPPSRSGGPVE